MIYLKVFLTLLTVLATGGSYVVQTNTGPVQGKLVAHGHVEAFLGVPYAEPPIGSLRLAKPVPKKPWQGIYDATRLPPACVHDTSYPDNNPNKDYMSEDCLYLNLWVPRSTCTDELKRIMMYIHGGAFVHGASNLPLYDGAKLADHGDVIIVTMNYRLGGLGFLTDFTDDAPGSLALYDQVEAIKWIKNNAKYFNGNPENIVLFGESCGAWSISLHQISPLSKSLFKRAILQSGSELSPKFDNNNSELKRMNHDYANLVGCKYDAKQLDNIPKDVIECLRKVPAEKFPKIDVEVYIKRHTFPAIRIGNDFLKETTIDAYRKGDFKDSEVLMGINRNEGTFYLIRTNPSYFGNFGKKFDTSKFNETMAYISIKTIVPNEDPAEVDKIIRGYFDDVNTKTNYTYLEAASEAIGDCVINCGVVFQAEYQSLRSNPVFFYMFDHRRASTPFAKWMGVVHTEEVQFVFGNPSYENFTKYEMKLSKGMMDMWTTFAKTGNPTILYDESLPRYTYQHPVYFTIGKHNRVGLRPDHYRCDRWRKLQQSAADKEARKQKN